LKLKCDEPLSKTAFNFNLRHYTGGASTRTVMLTRVLFGVLPTLGGALQLASIKTRVESVPGFSA
jgi:hypothetical protein